jgi:tripartite ATP-independent transporter DctM subunit
LLPPSPLVLIYCYVTGVDVAKAYTATLWPGLVLVLILSVYAVVVSLRQRIPTQKFDLQECAREFWMVKWEALAPVLVLSGLATGLMELHESAAAAALYTLIVEVYIYKDLSWKKVLHVARDAMSLAGAIIIILAMATALTNYIIHLKVPKNMLDWFVEQGMSEPWQFIIVLNVFLFIMGMLMDAFSVLLVALPLLVPLAANFGMHPFYLAVMFLLNLEIAYITPPVGLNLFIASARFKRPVVEIYRVVLPFMGLLMAGLLLIIFVPQLSSFTVSEEVAELRAEAAKHNLPPTEAWALECIQEDRNNLRPCSDEDIATWGEDGKKLPASADPEPGEPEPQGKESADDLEDELLEGFDDDEEGDEGGGAPEKKKKEAPETVEDLEKEF